MQMQGDNSIKDTADKCQKKEEQISCDQACKEGQMKWKVEEWRMILTVLVFRVYYL